MFVLMVHVLGNDLEERLSDSLSRDFVFVLVTGHEKENLRLIRW